MHFSLAITVFSLTIFTVAIPRPVVESNGIAMKLSKLAPFPSPDDTIDADVLNAHVASLSAKILRTLDNYERNTGMAHPYAVNPSRMRERGAGAPLTSDQDKLWYAEISIGTPPETFSVEIDTGSSDMFVPWYLCDSSCDGHTSWNPDESSTAESVLKGFSLKYGDGSSVTGMQYMDNVTIAGFTADKQTIGAAITYSSQFQKDRWTPDGMLGMAFESISIYKAKPFFATLVADSKVTEPVFSLKLTSDAGELYIGGANPELYDGEFTYTPVTLQGYWQVEIESIQDGQENVILTDVPAIIDTGANWIIGDPMRVAMLYKALGGMYVGKGFFCFPCTSFPTISLTFSGKSFEIRPELLNLGRISEGSSKCYSSIVAKNTGVSFWVIGNAFLSSYYTTFDFSENPRVGFADLQ